MKGVCRIIREGRGSIWIVFPPNVKKHVHYLYSVSHNFMINFTLFINRVRVLSLHILHKARRQAYQVSHTCMVRQ